MAGKPRLLTLDQVHRIRTTGESDAVLAAEFGVSSYSIRTARSGHRWKDHPTPPVRRPPGLPVKPDLPCQFDPAAFAMPGEEWRPAVGWEVHYRVSNMGRVYSLHQTGRMVIGMCVNGTYRILKVRSQGRKANLPVHCMVLEAFVGPRPTPSHEGCHNNGKPGDNRLDNLRWDTAVANSADKVRHGTARYRRGGIALDPERVHEMRTNPDITLDTWAILFGVSRACVAAARAGRTWRNVQTPPLLKLKRTGDDSRAEARP
jgi:hypothetical protein